LLVFRIADTFSPVVVGEVVLQQPFEGSCWNVSGEVRRKHTFFDIIFYFLRNVICWEYVMFTSKAMFSAIIINS
jgi:hypothetical protein